MLGAIVRGPVLVKSASNCDCSSCNGEARKSKEGKRGFDWLELCA